MQREKNDGETSPRKIFKVLRTSRKETMTQTSGPTPASHALDGEAYLEASISVGSSSHRVILVGTTSLHLPVRN